MILKNGARQPCLLSEIFRKKPNFRKTNCNPSRRINSSVFFFRKNNYYGSFKAPKELAEKSSPELLSVTLYKINHPSWLGQRAGGVTSVLASADSKLLLGSSFC